MRRYVLLCFLVALVVAVLPATTVAADEPAGPSLTVPVDTAAFGDPGSVHLLASVAVDASLYGSSCAVTAVADNNESVHPGSTLTIASGDSSVTLPEVESSPDQVTHGDGTLVLGAALTVSVTLGPDGVFSGGIDVTVTCAAPPPPTEPPTTEPPTTVPTTVPPTTVPPTTVPPAPPAPPTPDAPAQLTSVVSPPVVLVAPPATPVPAQPQTTG